MAKWQCTTEMAEVVRSMTVRSGHTLTGDLRAAITAAVGAEVDGLRDAILRWSSAEYQHDEHSAGKASNEVHEAREEALGLCGCYVCDDCEAHYPATEHRDDELCPDCGREVDISAAEIADDEEDT
jgi:hypothetical protein